MLIGTVYTVNGRRELHKLASFKLIKGVAVPSKESNPKFIKRILERGIVGQKGKTFKIEDGEDFIRQLPFAFRGFYESVEIVEEYLELDILH